MNQKKLVCKKVVRGIAEGKALVSHEPITFVGGVDPETGIVSEKKHELNGCCMTKRVLVFPTGKGSTGGSNRIYDMACRGTAPAAIVNQQAEPVTAIGAIMGEIPMVHRFEEDPVEAIKTGDWVRVEADAGVVIVTKGEE